MWITELLFKVLDIVLHSSRIQKGWNTVDAQVAQFPVLLICRVTDVWSQLEEAHVGYSIL